MKRVIVVEDDESIGELLRDYLELNGFGVSVFTNGIDGLNNIKKEECDLLILDVMLPGLDGFEILRQIRDEKDIPVLIVSAKKEEVDKIRGLRLGADDYITKPFSPGELVARVNAHITKYERLRSKFGKKESLTIITIKGMEIHKDARRVFVKGKEINLAQKEFELLLFLSQNPNRVFGKDELLDKVWGYDSFGDVATVTVHVARIREKTEEDPSNPQYIETVWGAGYTVRT